MTVYDHYAVGTSYLEAAIEDFDPPGLCAKVRPEKSQLWKIKSLYQRNRIPTAFHKLDLIAAYKHTQAQRGLREQHIVLFFPCLSLPAQ